MFIFQNRAMPKEKDITNHPCHLLSLPSAKRFWCRHCMTVFEDAITRWRHSRSCRYGVVNNFMRRRELETKALQNTAVLNPADARFEQSIQMCDLASVSLPDETNLSNQHQLQLSSESFSCFICHKKFASLEEMRAHVKYPCRNSRIITTRVPHPKHSVPVFVDSLPGHNRHWQQLSQQTLAVEHQQDPSFMQVHNSQHPPPAQIKYEIEIQPQEVEPQYDTTMATLNHSEDIVSDSITPTKIYVNEQGETVIEVENFDLNSDGGELSLAHLLTQLSQQGIVFDKTRSIPGSPSSSNLYTTDADYLHPKEASREEETQPTAEDAANTLAQLAGLRSFTRTNQIKPTGETPLHSEIHTVQKYKDSISSSGSSRHFGVNTQPQLDIEYACEYSGIPSPGEHSIVSSQQMTHQTALICASQEYKSIKVKHEAVNEAIQIYTDTSSATYITEEDGQQQIPMDAEAVSSTGYSRHGSVVNDGNKTVLVQHYPVQIDGSGHLIHVPADMSGKQAIEAQNGLLSEEFQAVDSEIPSVTAHENSTGITSFETSIPVFSTQISELSGTSLDREVKAEVRGSQISTEADEFPVQTVSLQEIVDSETSALTFVEQTPNRSCNEHFMFHVSDMHAEPMSLTLAASSEVRSGWDNDTSQVTSVVLKETEGRAHPTGLFIVTSTGILPISSQNL